MEIQVPRQYVLPLLGRQLLGVQSYEHLKKTRVMRDQVETLVLRKFTCPSSRPAFVRTLLSGNSKISSLEKCVGFGHKPEVSCETVYAALSLLSNSISK